MIIHSSHLLLLYFFVCSIQSNQSANGNDSIEALDSHQRVKTGARAVLRCQLKSSSIHSYQLIWIRTNPNENEVDLVLAHNTDVLINDPRLSVQRGEIDYSLSIENVTGEDRGIYACEMNSDPSPERGWIDLQVEGKRQTLS